MSISLANHFKSLILLHVTFMIRYAQSGRQRAPKIRLQSVSR